TGVLSIFARQIQEGRTLGIFEDGDIVRDFVLVDDVVEAFRLMGTCPQMPRDILDIGSGETASIRDVASTMLQMFGRPGDDLTITGQFRPGDIRHAVADISAARKALDWSPRVTLRDGLQRLVDWSRQQPA
ncbi:MAG: NAD-dependent epimerase/dehydratase family protein, partial [Roseovarius sp.]